MSKNVHKEYKFDEKECWEWINLPGKRDELKKIASSYFNKEPEYINSCELAYTILKEYQKMKREMDLNSPK